MKCLSCGAEMLPPEAGNAEYPVGMPVFLIGVPIHRCSNPDCDEEEVEIPHIGELHRRLVEAVASKPDRLAPVEITFLRKSLGWSGQDLAHRFQTTPVTVSRWEHGRSAMNRQAELLLRLLAVCLPPIEEYTSEGPVRDSTASTVHSLRLGMAMFCNQLAQDEATERQMPEYRDGRWCVPVHLLREELEGRAVE